MSFWLEYAAILFGITVFYFLVRFWLYKKMKGLEGRSASSLSLIKDTAPNGNYLLYFYSPNCGACKMMTPIIDRFIAAASEKSMQIRKIDISMHPEAARAFSIMGTPTLILITEGVIRTVKVGAVREKEVESLVAQL